MEDNSQAKNVLTAAGAIIAFLRTEGYEAEYDPETNQIRVPSTGKVFKPKIREVLQFLLGEGVTLNPKKKDGTITPEDILAHRKKED